MFIRVHTLVGQSRGLQNISTKLTQRIPSHNTNAKPFRRRRHAVPWHKCSFKWFISIHLVFGSRTLASDVLGTVSRTRTGESRERTSWWVWGAQLRCWGYIWISSSLWKACFDWLVEYLGVNRQVAMGHSLVHHLLCDCQPGTGSDSQIEWKVANSPAGFLNWQIWGNQVGKSGEFAMFCSINSTAGFLNWQIWGNPVNLQFTTRVGS